MKTKYCIFFGAGSAFLACNLFASLGFGETKNEEDAQQSTRCDCLTASPTAEQRPISTTQKVRPSWGEFFLEYSRGRSEPTRADLRFRYGDTDLTFHDVRFADRSFYPDNSTIPHEPLKRLGNLHFVDAVKSATEPYYGIRLFYFF